MVYVVLKENKIVFTCHSSTEQGVYASLKNEGITEYDSVQHISNDYFTGAVNQDIREFDENYNLLPLSERKDFVMIPEGKKIEGDEFVDLSTKEKIDEGLIKLDEKQIYDETTKQIRFKDVDELYNDNLIAKDEWYKVKNANCLNLRKSAYSSESDGLFFDYQREQVDKSVWLKKVEEIKTKYPKPSMEN